MNKNQRRPVRESFRKIITLHHCSLTTIAETNIPIILIVLFLFLYSSNQNKRSELKAELPRYCYNKIVKRLLLLALFTIFISLIAVLILTELPKQNSIKGRTPATETNVSEAHRKGKRLSNDQCQGMERKELGTLPMRPEDFSMIIPYGLVVGDHVTPIDHQYFSPSIFDSPRDLYEVRAMADAHLVDVQPRTKPDYTEYRLVFSISCRVFYYYDLVTSLSPEIKKEFDLTRNGLFPKPLNIPIKEGQIVGRIGGQTLDFAVWDTEVSLPGFIDPRDYEEESWKIHTVDPLDYYSPKLKQEALTKYIRKIPPVSGKIDYDMDGRLIGNWFQEGSDGYRGTKARSIQGYSQTHLAVVPNHLDPSVYMASFGNFGGRFAQFAIKGEPDPKDVGPDLGLIKYDLFNFRFIKEGGQEWDGKSLTANPRIRVSETSLGCVLFQLISTRRLRVETLPNTACQNVSNFNQQSLIYYR